MVVLRASFQEKKGLRQGNSMLPLLFMIFMEYLSMYLVVNHPFSFKFHKNCKYVNLNHFCFINDLFLFNYGNVEYVRFFAGALQHFQNILGFQVNKDKSLIFFANVDNEVKAQILQVLSFKEGNLPLKYLILPLCLLCLLR